MNQRPALSVALPEIAVASAVAHRRDPRIQEVRAEGEDGRSVVDVEVRQHVLPEDLLDGRMQIRALQRLIRYVTATVSGHEPLDYEAEVRAHGVGSHDHAGLITGFLLNFQLLGQTTHGIGPADLAEAAGSSLPHPQHRSAYAVRMIERLESGLAPRAVLSAVGGIIDVAFDLLGAPLHYATDDSLGGGALAADSGIPVVDPGDEVLGHLDGGLNEELLFRDAAGLE